MSEQIKNNASSHLATNIGSGDTSLTVTTGEGANFPSTGDFRLVIGSEILICTARSGDTLTVSRGQESTTAASHSSGDAVTHVLTAGGIAAYIADVFLTAVTIPAGMASGETIVYNGSTWVRSSVTNIGPSSLGSGSPSITTFLRGDGSWASPSGSPPTRQVFTTGTGTYTLPAGCTKILVECIGGGGGGASTTGGGGGGGGGYASSMITSPSSSYAYSVGGGGSAAGAGSNTTFGSTLVVAPGGNAGSGASGGAGGSGGTGDILVTGGGGTAGATSAGGTGGDGAGPYGGGGAAGKSSSSGGGGGNYGGGGGGEVSSGGGGAGGGGIIVVTEFY